MKKPVLLLAAFIVSSLSQMHADTISYLVNFGPSNATVFSGSPTIFDGSTGTALSSSTIVVNPPVSGETYTLTSGALTYSLALTGSTYSFGASGTAQTAVTESFAYQTGGGQNTFTLTGLSTNDIVTFEFLGSSQNFLSNVSVVAGATAPTSGTTLVAAAPNGSTPQFTDVATLAGATEYSGVFTQYNGGEGDISAMLVTVQQVPEPSSYAMLAAGLVGLAFYMRSRRRSVVA